MKKILFLMLTAVLLLVGCSSSDSSSGGLEGIAAYPETMNLSVGEFQTIQVVLTPADGPQDLIFATSNQSVAVVDVSGKVTAVGAGACTITVASQIDSDVSCYVEVIVGGGQTAPQQTETVVISDGDVGYVRETDPTRVYPTYYLSDGEVAAMAPEQLQFVINQIYAKNGYIFSKDHIQSYFSQMPWYTPVSRDANSLKMSSVDRANLNLLVKHRNNSGNSVSDLGWMWTRYAVDSELTSSYVANLSDYDIQLLINTIYAKNGYIFETDSLQAMFEGQPWYQGITRDGKSLKFSALDQKNLRLLTSYRG
ncbi:MAG: YARHG domain-containing protein [Ruminiclostridium sp.]|nr:YARHG domain-containing protein [Ruminiclostridium sp.]